MAPSKEIFSAPNSFNYILELIMQWLALDSRGYKIGTSNCEITTIAYADDMAILTDDVHNIRP